MKQIAVKFLKKGMKLSSGAEVMSDPQRGINTPAGKCEIRILYPGGTQKVVEWGTNTKVNIIQ